MMFVQKSLPYSYGALKPFLSKEQVQCHFEQHYAKYIGTLNALTKNHADAKLPLEDLIVLKKQGLKAGREIIDPVFNNAAQVWNHEFYFNCMSPKGGGMPGGGLLECIHSHYGTFERFAAMFRATATDQFGSGWGWLVWCSESKKLMTLSTLNADNPLGTCKVPLLCVDVWEHAYYLSYQGQRDLYLMKFFDKINWNFVEKNLKAALAAPTLKDTELGNAQHERKAGGDTPPPL